MELKCCPKCGGDKSKIEYIKEHKSYGVTSAIYHDECLRITCEVCGYIYETPTKDKGGK